MCMTFLDKVVIMEGKNQNIPKGVKTKNMPLPTIPRFKIL